MRLIEKIARGLDVETQTSPFNNEHNNIQYGIAGIRKGVALVQKLMEESEENFDELKWQHLQDLLNNLEDKE